MSELNLRDTITYAILAGNNEVSAVDAILALDEMQRLQGVCEWKYTIPISPETQPYWKTSCDRSLRRKVGRYCPECGKVTKEVEK